MDNGSTETILLGGDSQAFHFKLSIVCAGSLFTCTKRRLLILKSAKLDHNYFGPNKVCVGLSCYYDIVQSKLSS